MAIIAVVNSIHEYSSTGLSGSLGGNYFPATLRFPLLPLFWFPTVRPTRPAHRLRSAVAAGLIRDLFRLVSAAAR
jgi:hypothetical protein